MKLSEYKYYMDLSHRASQNSKAVRLKVGAILVRDGKILADAWNGTPPGWPNECEYEVDGILVSHSWVLHAEKNILRKMANSHEVIRGATLIMTHNPCMNCAADFIGLGLKELVYRDPYRIDDGLQFLIKDGTIVRTFQDVLDEK